MTDDYTGLTDDQTSAQRLCNMESYARALASSDGSTAWGAVACDAAEVIIQACEVARQALHDRDRYHRDAEYWREECIKLTGEALA